MAYIERNTGKRLGFTTLVNIIISLTFNLRKGKLLSISARFFAANIEIVHSRQSDYDSNLKSCHVLSFETKGVIIFINLMCPLVTMKNSIPDEVSS